MIGWLKALTLSALARVQPLLVKREPRHFARATACARRSLASHDFEAE